MHYTLKHLRARSSRVAHRYQVDYKTVMMPGAVLWMTGMTSILGRDFSGVVVRSNSPKFAVGDRVFGNSTSASLAEYTVAEAVSIEKLPDSVSHVDAASLPVAALTSLQAMVEHGGLKAGHKILIPGASGGTGSLGVQIAKCLGASVVAGVCSGANAEMVKALGADVVADYALGMDGVEAALRSSGHFDLDMTYDCVTSPEDPNYEPLSRKLLKPHGMHVAINGVDGDWMRLIFSTRCGLNLHRTDYRLFTARTDGGQTGELAQLAGWVAEGKLKPLIDAKVAFTEADVLAAYAKLKGRRTKGKMVVELVAV
jgi:NADPH:quinone reductase-like Zn-dependent oxidoreductase